MCGIAGIYAYHDPAPPVDRDELARIRDAMAKRGPDGAGLWLAGDARVGLAHRRLAIIDLSPAGAQPMASADGLLTITFNGEIYNYRELRRELEGRGFVFVSSSDTEVLLHLYADRGERMLDALRGMFAFAIWDARAKRLFVARDHFGIKPLYWADDGRAFRFASSVDALAKSGGVDTAEDVAGKAGFFLWGAVPEPFTFHRSIRALPAGAYMHVDRNGSAAPVRYFSIGDEFRKAEAAPSRASSGEMREQIRATLRESMRHHMVADVPVGIFLSGGVDSTALAALGAELNPALQALTLGFGEYRGTNDDETAIAEATAVALGLAQQTRWIERAHFRGEWTAFFAGMDQPSTDGVNSYLVSSAAAASRLKVAISGLGGDELFGGYPSFRDVPRIARAMPRAPGLGRFARALSAPLLRTVTSPKYAGLLEYGGTYAGAYLLRRALHMPWELARIVGGKRAGEALAQLRPLAALDETIAGLANERCIVAALELACYMRNQLLRDCDWAGMAHGVEIRVPFVDVAVLRTLAPMLASANPPTKADLAAAIAHPRLTAISARPKTGFTVPVRDWLRDELPDEPAERGLRGWSHVVARMKGGRRFLSFITDGFGGHGGIALHNRDFLTVLSTYPGCVGVTALPRHMPQPPESMPAKLDYVVAATRGKLRYIAAAWRILGGDRRYDLVVCGHINLAPIAWLAGKLARAPVLMFVHGIEAWQPTKSRLANALAPRMERVVAVSNVTAERFRLWSGYPTDRLKVLPNAVHAEWYGPGPKDAALAARYGLGSRKVLMTLGRLVSAERYKGFDEVMELLPKLSRAVPDLAYLVVGDGSDRTRLEAKARALGLGRRVVFAGNIAESEKAIHYRLADVYVMPSRGEGFGYVLLEAMACGVPVIASAADGTREALKGGELGALVNPGDPDELERAILQALAKSRGVVPPGLAHFAFANFEARAHALIGDVLRRPPQPREAPVSPAKETAFS